MIVIVLGKADWNTSFKCIVSAIISQNYNGTRNYTMYVILVLAMSSVQETCPTLHLKISSRNCTVLTFSAKKVKLSWSICITSDGLDTARNQLHGVTDSLATSSIYPWNQLFSSLVLVDQKEIIHYSMLTKSPKKLKFSLVHNVLYVRHR